MLANCNRLQKVRGMKANMVAAFAILTFAPACFAATSPWNGTWKLDRSRPEPDGAAEDYRFTVGADASLRWEIPSLKEVNIGRLDGTPMRINRPGAPAGETISVWQEAATIWRYKVVLNGQDRGQGRMTLGADGKSWTDVPLDGDKPVETLLMVYVKE
jgi:hypothetical protein